MMRLDWRELGRPGIAAIGLTMFCVSFFLGTVEPLADDLARLKREEARLSSQIARTPSQGKEERIATPPWSAAQDLSERISAAVAKAGFSIEHAALRQLDENGFRRVEIAFSLKGTYPMLRDAVDELLAVSPIATLDEFSLHRNGSREPMVEANLRLSYYFLLP